MTKLFHFYFVRPASEAKNHCLSIISTFTPALSVKRSHDQYFGGFLVNSPNLRKLSEYSDQDWIFGVEHLEGGNGLVDVPRLQVFETKEEAEQFERLNKTLSPTIRRFPKPWEIR